MELILQDNTIKKTFSISQINSYNKEILIVNFKEIHCEQVICIVYDLDYYTIKYLFYSITSIMY